MFQNKKIILLIIICGLILSLLPSAVLAEDSYYDCYCTALSGDSARFQTYSSQSECQTKCTTTSGGACSTYKSAQCKASSSSGSSSSESKTKTKSSYLTNPLGETNAATIIGTAIKAILGVVGSVALLMFIYGGFLWLTSGGSEQRITKGKGVLVWAVIGLLVIFASYTLVSFVIKGLSSSSSSKSKSSSKSSSYEKDTDTVDTSTSGGCCEDELLFVCSDASSASKCGEDETYYSGQSCNSSTGKCG